MLRLTSTEDFSNVVRKSSLERLAEADDNEVVKGVQEYFADYIVVNTDVFSLDLALPRQRLWSNSPDAWNPNALQRCTEGVLALLLSLKKKPLIRYQKNSLMAKKLATEVRYQITQEEQLFDFRKTDTPPILLLLDRRDDPITPLLTQWTYQAMVHELLGIYNGKVDLSDVPDVRPELKEIVLSQDQDPFFKKNMYLNFGDLGGNIKEYVEQYQTKTQSNAAIESIADMKRFVEDYPEFRKLSGNVSKHVTLVGELSRRVGVDGLLDVSELEQSLACNDSHAADLKVCSIPALQYLKVLIPRLELAKTDFIPATTSGQQTPPGSSLFAKVRAAFIERTANAIRPSFGSWQCSSTTSGPHCESISLPSFAPGSSSFRRIFGFVRVGVDIFRGTRSLQGTSGSGKCVYTALAKA